MTTAASALILTSVAAFDASADGGAGALDDYLWRNRLVLSFQPAADDARGRHQREEQRNAWDLWRERHLLLIEIDPGNRVTVNARPRTDLSAEALRRRFAVDDEHYAAILIGKDGGEKMRRAGAIENAELFSVIDAIPMRRREMGTGD